MSNDPEASAMAKLLRGPVPFSTTKLPSVVASFRAQASELSADDPVRSRLLAEADEREKETIEGELWPLTHREHWRIKALLVEGAQVASDLSPVARQAFVEGLVGELRAQMILRKTGTNGKVHVWTHDEAAEADTAAVRAINLAYAEAFMLTGDEVPKAPTPR